MNEHRETELRLFDVDADSIRSRLTELNASFVGTYNFKRAVIDVKPASPNKWIRVRTDGTTTTLAIKQRISSQADGTGEVEVGVSDYDATLLLLNELGGYVPRSTQESKREQFLLDGAEVSIDIWPQLAPLIEVEADEEKKIWQVVEQLGVDRQRMTSMPVEDYYREKLGIDVKVTRLQF